MKSELSIKDPGTLSQEEAATLFQQIVQEIITEQGLDVSAAWAKARALNPTVYAKLCQGRQPVPADALGNDIAPLNLPPPDGNNKIFYLSAMKLPPSTPDDVFAACWRANGGKASPLKAKDVWLALVTALAKKYDWTAEVARSEAIDFAPALAVAAGQKPAQ